MRVGGIEEGFVYVESIANSRRLFFGENGGHLKLCSRRIDQGGPDQYYFNICFEEDSSLVSIFILSDSLVVASSTYTLKVAVRTEILFLDEIAIKTHS